MLIDSHCHLDYIVERNPSDNITDIIKRAQQNDVSHMLTVCIDLQQFQKLVKIASNQTNVDITVGVHPTDVKEDVVTPEKLVELATENNVLAFGETGLDYFRSTRDEIVTQKESFISHIEAAVETKKPLVIHARDSFDDIYKILNNYRSYDLRGVMHCFTGTLDEAKQALDLGFMISFSGIITFKNAKELQMVASEIPLEYILIETDSPYLAPVPFRGKCNEPAFVKYVAEKLAMLKDISFDEVAGATTNNFKNLFKL